MTAAATGVVTASVGVSTCTGHASVDSVDGLVRDADAALYAAKAAGRDCVVVGGTGVKGAGGPRPAGSDEGT